MAPHAEGDILSRIEFVLPKNVLQTACNLSCGLGATFVSTNQAKRTATHIKLFKRNDESVSINCTVRALSTEQLHQPEHILIDQVKSKQASVLVSPQQSPTKEASRSLLRVNNAADVRGDAVETPVKKTEPEVVIPESLLMHDDVAPSTGSKESDVVPPGGDRDENIDKQEVDATFESTVKVNNKEQNQKLGDETESLQLTKDNKKDEAKSKEKKDMEENKNKEMTTENAEKKSNKLQKLSAEKLKESKEKVNIRSSLRSGKEIGKLSKQISAKSPGKSAKKSDSPSRQVVLDTNPRRPRRTVHLPARLAESEVMMDRKRTLPAVENSPTKRAKHEQEEKTMEHEKSEEPVGEFQESENALSSGHHNLRKKRKVKKGRPRLSAESRQKTDAEKMKAEKTLGCPVCGKLMKEYENVFDHVKKQHEDHADFGTIMADLKEKMKTTCHICGKEISRPSAIKMHIETMHTDQTQAECEDCGAILKSQRHLDLHMKRCHLVTAATHLCHLCPASFKVKQYLVTHIKNVHGKSAEVNFQCDQCTKTFSTERYMKTHKLRVHGPKKFLCPHCSMGFSEPPNLRRHIRLIHDAPKHKRHFCPQCEKGFTLQSNLKEHIQTIHLRKYPFTCAVCGEGFSRRKQLEAHQSESHRSGVLHARFKHKRGSGNSYVAISKDSTDQLIEIHPQSSNVVTVHTMSGEEGNQLQTLGGAVVQELDGTTIQTIGGSTIVQTVDTLETIQGSGDHIIQVPTQTADGSSVAIRVPVEEGVTDESVQFCIVATPEMLEAFGLQEDRK